MDEIVIIGGPNGAGKTTAAQLLVPHGLEIREFVNADEIARGLSPFSRHTRCPSMGNDRKSKTMTEKTPREILDAIDNALKETAVRVAAAKPRRLLHPPQPNRPAVPARPKTPREILDAIDKALAETARQFVDRGH